MKLEEIITKLSQIEEQAALTLTEYPHTEADHLKSVPDPRQLPDERPSGKSLTALTESGWSG